MPILITILVISAEVEKAAADAITKTAGLLAKTPGGIQIRIF